jgi:hypothetical protein
MSGLTLVSRAADFAARQHAADGHQNFPLRLCGHVRPTTGDRVRLADTDLIIEVEKDFTVYGEEVKFGGGKVIRDGMGQSQITARAGRGRHRHHQCADRRSLGHRQSRRRDQGRLISAIGKAGNPDIQPGVTIRHRPRHRHHRGRGQDSHRRRFRQRTSISSARSRSNTR